jgi:hypothetical protein
LRAEKLPAARQPLADGGKAMAARFRLVETGTLGSAIDLNIDGGRGLRRCLWVCSSIEHVVCQGF